MIMLSYGMAVVATLWLYHHVVTLCSGGHGYSCYCSLLWWLGLGLYLYHDGCDGHGGNHVVVMLLLQLWLCLHHGGE
jgi:hypothetical protein